MPDDMLNKPHGEAMAEEYEIQELNAAMYSDPPVSKEEADIRLGEEPDPNYNKQNVVDPICGGLPEADPHDFENPPMEFLGRQNDAEPDAFEIQYQSQLQGDTTEPSSQEDETKTPSDEEVAPAAPVSEESDSDDASINILPGKSEEPETTPPSSEFTETNNTEHAQQESEPSSSSNTEQESSPAPEEKQKKPLSCPHCGKVLYRKKSGDTQIFVHAPKDAETCNCCYTSLEEIAEDRQKTKEAQKKLAQILEKEKQEREERAKKAAITKAASQSNKAGYVKLVSPATDPSPQPSNNTESLQIITSQINNLSQNQTNLHLALTESIGTLRVQQEKLLMQNESLAEKLVALQAELQKMDLSGALEEFAEVNQAIDSHLAEFEKIKSIPASIVQKQEALDEATSQMISSTRYAEEQFLLYVNSTKELKLYEVKLKSMVSYLSDFMRDTDERYRSAVDEAIKKYGEVKTDLGKQFESESQKFFQQANQKLLKGMKMPGSDSHMTGYICAFVVAFILMLLYSYIR